MAITWVTLAISCTLFKHTVGFVKPFTEHSHSMLNPHNTWSSTTNKYSVARKSSTDQGMFQIHRLVMEIDSGNSKIVQQNTHTT